VVVHNEQSTGVASRIAEIARDRSRQHPARSWSTRFPAGLDRLSAEEWRVDGYLSPLTQGLMLPPDSLHAVSERRSLRRRRRACPRSYWDWQPMLQANDKGYFPYTPATNLLYGLKEALASCRGGLANVSRATTGMPRRPPCRQGGGSKSCLRSRVNIRVR